VLFLTLLLACAGSPAALADDDKRRLSLTGTGTVSAAPDKAHISTGVVSDAASASAALAANNRAMTRIIAELKTQGLAAKDIQTANFSVQPLYRRFKDGRPAEITGYRVTNSVRITVRDLPRLGTILDKVVTLGSNRINGIEFALDDAEKLRDAARRKAVADATRKARLYAESAGVRLGDVLSISETTAYPPRPVYRARLQAAPAAAVPVQSGEQSIQVQVNMSWALK